MDLKDVDFEVARAHQSNQCSAQVVSVYTVPDQPGIEMQCSAVQTDGGEPQCTPLPTYQCRISDTNDEIGVPVRDA